MSLGTGFEQLKRQVTNPEGRLRLKSYKDLEIYRESFELAMEMHELSLAFPRVETFEEGSQLRK